MQEIITIDLNLFKTEVTSEQHGKLSMKSLEKKTNNIDDVIVKNFKSEDIAKTVNCFAKNFNENINKIIHKCDIKTLDNNERTQQNSIYITPTSENEILNIIKTLNTKKGAGIDGIRPKDLVKNAKTITPVITTLINRSIESATVPDLLKISHIQKWHNNRLQQLQAHCNTSRH